MKLNLRSTEKSDFLATPEYPDHYRPQLEVLRGQIYQDRKIVLDNRQFENCEFHRCEVLYSGGPVSIHDCDIDDDCLLRLSGAAFRGAMMWGLFEQRKRSMPTPF